MQYVGDFWTENFRRNSLPNAGEKFHTLILIFFAEILKQVLTNLEKWFMLIMKPFH